jgi:hypothetical protein
MKDDIVVVVIIPRVLSSFSIDNYSVMGRYELSDSER